MLIFDGTKGFIWNDQSIKGLRLTGPNKAKATIIVYPNTYHHNSIQGGASNCPQVLYDALEKARNIVKKAMVTNEQAEGLEDLLKAAGWEVYPA